MPTLEIQANLQEALSRLDQLLPREQVPRVVGHPRGVQNLEPSTMQGRREALVAVGPEAGWSEEEPCELDLLSSAGFQSITLGQRILRTDVATATLLALTEQMLT
ncbi:unnamed protein product [Symbiodinium natans]|uniref:Ribosomal RNA small subunit methyltransferase E methyltransferase domain-containing protein n=1 Tax=Symbiodinium natans TaxID=878477 RepID=A0A812LBJ8_9DINO|nr:unnamed protein product [Symbiodinium natans]